MRRALFLINLLVCYTNAEVLFDERLIPLVKHFKEYAADYWPVTEPPLKSEAWNNLIIRIEPTSGADSGGECLTEKGGKRFITFSSELWFKCTPEQREAILFHELGHCVLGLEHDDKQCGDRPCHLMNSTSFSGEDYLKHKHEYLQDLFINGAIKQRKAE